MSVTGWIRIIAGSILLSLGIGTTFALFQIEIANPFIYHERLEYVGIGFDEISTISIPLGPIVKSVFAVILLFLGYRLLRKAETP